MAGIERYALYMYDISGNYMNRLSEAQIEKDTCRKDAYVRQVHKRCVDNIRYCFFYSSIPPSELSGTLCARSAICHLSQHVTRYSSYSM